MNTAAVICIGLGLGMFGTAALLLPMLRERDREIKDLKDEHSDAAQYTRMIRSPQVSCRGDQRGRFQGKLRDEIFKYWPEN